MAENVYEGMVLLDSSKYARNQAGVADRVNAAIKKCGGEILVSRLWDERRLAYPIGKHRKGTYWLTYIRLDSLNVTTLNREFRLDDNVLRSMVIKIEPRLVDALVSHAKGEVKVEDKPKADDKVSDATTTDATTTDVTTTDVTTTDATTTDGNTEKGKEAVTEGAAEPVASKTGESE